MKTLLPFIGLALLLPNAASSQGYCSPTFTNGCFNWQTLSASIGSINYTSGPDCTVGDYTSLSTAANAGDTLAMTVVNGVWCGVSVWIDLNQDLAFDNTENMHHQYVGGAPDYTYNFDVIIPPGTPNGTYRMRLISPWGSDGFSNTNQNGFGPCGAFQYGNYQDFTVTVGLGTAISEGNAVGFNVYPNPASDLVFIGSNGQTYDQVTLFSSSGKEVMSWAGAVSGTNPLHVGDLSIGLYTIMIEAGAEKIYRTLSIVR